MPPSDRDPSPSAEEQPEKASELFELVYEELRKLARNQLRNRPSTGTLHTTALVHEAWLKLVGGREERQISRPHFLALAATAMRHVLANHAQSRRTAKRGDGWQRVTLNQELRDSGDEAVDLVNVSDTLEELWSLNPRHGRLAELRLLAGLEMKDCAEVLEISLATVEREWRLVRAWVGARLGGSA